MSSDPPWKPTITITTTSGNVANLRSRVARDRLVSDGCGGALLVREVFEALAVGPGEPAIVVSSIERGVP